MPPGIRRRPKGIYQIPFGICQIPAENLPVDLCWTESRLCWTPVGERLHQDNRIYGLEAVSGVQFQADRIRVVEGSIHAPTNNKKNKQIEL